MLRYNITRGVKSVRSIILLYRTHERERNMYADHHLPICEVRHSSHSSFGRDRSVGTAIRGDETVRTGPDSRLHHSPLAFELRLRSFKWQKEKTGEMPSLEAAASEFGRRGNQGAVRSVDMQMELKAGEMPSLEAAASELGSIRGRKSLGKPKGNAILWAKVVQITRFDEEIPGTEKCADIKSKFAAEMCHQGLGVSYSNCITKYIGMWFKYARESADNSPIIFHANAGMKRCKLTILTAKPTVVEDVCETVYLKESKSHREKINEAMVKSRSSNS